MSDAEGNFLNQHESVSPAYSHSSFQSSTETLSHDRGADLDDESTGKPYDNYATSEFSLNSSSTTNSVATNPVQNSNRDSDALLRSAYPVCRDFKFRMFMEKHSKILGLGIKHAVSDSFMEDCIRDLTSEDEPHLRYTSFKSIREALLRNSGVESSEHRCCGRFYKALRVRMDYSVTSCGYCSQSSGANPATYEYISICCRLQRLLASPIEGPRLFD
ncbi:hypothetical protein FGB62_329g010 [Gracilaria domingensis]|nr:hypothetical protein FGB62_329g010 [Gracilaria domingensis]